MEQTLEQTTLLSGALRRGKWTPDEEVYTAAIIQYFLSGVLSIQYGTMLRGYIAQRLHCDPMRVSKKLVPGSVLVGVRIDPKIGRRSYYPCAEGTRGLEAHQDGARRRLAQLRVLFIESIEREEIQNHASPTNVVPLVDLRRLSPLRPERERLGAISRPSISFRPLTSERTVNDPADAAMPRPPSLPSLSDLLRQNRLRIPSKTTLPPPLPSSLYVVEGPTSYYQHVDLLHESALDYTSPPRSSDGTVSSSLPPQWRMTPSPPYGTGARSQDLSS